MSGPMGGGCRANGRYPGCPEDGEGTVPGYQILPVSSQEDRNKQIRFGKGDDGSCR